MSLISLLKKEGHWSKRNVLVLVFLLVILPSFFATASVVYQEVIPRNVPVAVVAENDDVSDNELTIVEGGLTVFTEPTVVDSDEQARTMLEREQVYAVVTVPPDITDQEADATFTLTVDGSIVPFQDPSQVIESLMEFQLDQNLAADITAEREVVGGENSLPEYLFPTFLMSLLIFFAFTYVPYNLTRESAVIDRLRVESSLEAVVAAKLLFLTALMAVPIVLFHVAALYYGYAIDSLAPGAIFVLLLTFLILSAFSMTVTVITRFSAVGRFVNVVTMLGIVALSALAFPVGFFSPVRSTIARLLPTHYAMIIVRSRMMKESSLALFSDWLVGLLGLLVVIVVALKLSIVHYRRTT